VRLIDRRDSLRSVAYSAVGRVGATTPVSEEVAMTLIRRHSPLADVVTLRDAVDRLFDERFLRPVFHLNGDREIAPPLDLFTTPETVVAKVALPGVKPEDVEVTIADDLVTIRGSYKETTESTESGYVVKELSQGTFERTFAVPTAVKAEAATAAFEDGVLVVTLPKTEEVKPKRVQVQVTH
jgi:HSP20 family protein